MSITYEIMQECRRLALSRLRSAEPADVVSDDNFAGLVRLALGLGLRADIQERVAGSKDMLEKWRLGLIIPPQETRLVYLRAVIRCLEESCGPSRI
jgi:hypothetical protein